jgi:hypothetical protein
MKTFLCMFSCIEYQRECTLVKSLDAVCTQIVLQLTFLTPRILTSKHRTQQIREIGRNLTHFGETVKTFVFVERMCYL